MQLEDTWAKDLGSPRCLLFIEHLLGDSHFKYIILFNPHKTSQGRHLLTSLEDEETEDQRH